MEDNNGWDGLPLGTIKILEYLSDHTRIAMIQATEATDTPRTTLKQRMNKLIVLGFIVRYGKRRATWYGLKK